MSDAVGVVEEMYSDIAGSGRRFGRVMRTYRGVRPLVLSLLGGGSGATMIGWTNPTFGGTVAQLLDADGYYKNTKTAATTNADSGIVLGGANRFNHEFDVEFKFRLLETAARRCWIGLLNSDPITTDTPTTSHVALRVSTSAANTNFVISTADGTTQNIIDTGTVADTAIHKIRFATDFGETKIYYSWDDSALTVLTSNLPAASADLVPTMKLRTLAAVAKNLDIWYADGWSGK